MFLAHSLETRRSLLGLNLLRFCLCVLIFCCLGFVLARVVYGVLHNVDLATWSDRDIPKIGLKSDYDGL